MKPESISHRSDDVYAAHVLLLKLGFLLHDCGMRNRMRLRHAKSNASAVYEIGRGGHDTIYGIAIRSFSLCAVKE